ncbi:hypothetical protein, partial [Methylobacterium sp. B1]|uniref:hypothetical protein n=1 Tax=Methylobacterium sp. B1 TaxID=91459 RepID=UPI001AEC4A59
MIGAAVVIGGALLLRQAEPEVAIVDRLGRALRDMQHRRARLPEPRERRCDPIRGQQIVERRQDDELRRMQRAAASLRAMDSTVVSGQPDYKSSVSSPWG